LHCAATRKKSTALQALLAAKANVNLRDRFGSSALHAAAQCGYTPFARELVSRGAIVNYDGGDSRPPHGSAQMLVDMRASATAAAERNVTALHMTAYLDHAA